MKQSPVLNTPTLYILSGIPGSGKSTWSKKHPNFKQVSRDEIRMSLLRPGESYFSHEADVAYYFAKEIAASLKNGVNTIADATHISKASRERVLSAVKQYNTPFKVVFVKMNASLKDCLIRNDARSGLQKVSEKSIASMFLSYEPPECEEYPGSVVIEAE